MVVVGVVWRVLGMPVVWPVMRRGCQRKCFPHQHLVVCLVVVWRVTVWGVVQWCWPLKNHAKTLEI